MTRAMVPSGQMPLPVSPQVPKFGYLDVETHRAHRDTTGQTLRIYMDGADVTAVCAEADDRAGYCVLLCRDLKTHRDWQAKGAYHSAGDGVCTLRIEGDVLIVPGDPL